MSSDKRKLHNRAMKHLNMIGHGKIYKQEHGIGDSKELDYLLKHGYVEIKTVRPFRSTFHRNFVCPTESKILTEVL